jgi:hypothetical protein
MAPRRSAATLVVAALAALLAVGAAAADVDSPGKALVDVLLGNTTQAAEFRAKAGITGDPGGATIDLKTIKTCPTAE